MAPFGPGGSGDIVSRIVAYELEKMAGQPIITENKPGATGMVGTGIVRQAPADGHTLLHGSTSSLAANPSLYKQLPYDPDDLPRGRSTASSRASCWSTRMRRTGQ